MTNEMIETKTFKSQFPNQWFRYTNQFYWCETVDAWAKQSANDYKLVWSEPSDTERVWSELEVLFSGQCASCCDETLPLISGANGVNFCNECAI